ncbi:MAG: helix-turn-helix transcriptional regulator [Bacillota bacterium]|nr:helix-turn-helix transcriptional regulator [Bacillota bacterium]
MALVHDNIRKVRIAKGIKQCHVYESLGITRQMYHLFEKQGKGNNAEKIEAIANILEEKPGIFFDDKLTDAVIRKVTKGVGEYAKLRRSKRTGKVS